MVSKKWWNGFVPPQTKRMDNASLILRTLDRHLSQPARLILYGRAALQLGFTTPPREVTESKDVDAIIPLGDIEELSANESFS